MSEGGWEGKRERKGRTGKERGNEDTGEKRRRKELEKRLNVSVNEGIKRGRGERGIDAQGRKKTRQIKL